MTPRRQLSLAFIDSPACDWPSTVKERAKEVIKLSAELTAHKARMVELDLFDAAKIGQMQKVAEIHQRLANAYRNMSKELAYHLSQFTQKRIAELKIKP